MGRKGNIQIDVAKFRNLRITRGLTQDEFARAIGLTGSRVAQIERSEKAGVFLSVIRGIAEFTGERVEKVLLDLSAAAEPEPPLGESNLDMSTMRAVPEIPTFDLAVAAGPWVEVVEVAELHSDRQIDDGRFRIFIRGDSMEPDWPNGSLVEFRALRWGLDEVVIGEDYYIQVDDNATFKRLMKATDGEMEFRAVNREKYPQPFPVRATELKRMAKAEYLLIRPKRKGGIS